MKFEGQKITWRMLLEALIVVLLLWLGILEFLAVFVGQSS